MQLGLVRLSSQQTHLTRAVTEAIQLGQELEWTLRTMVKASRDRSCTWVGVWLTFLTDQGTVPCRAYSEFGSNHSAGGSQGTRKFGAKMDKSS